MNTRLASFLFPIAAVSFATLTMAQTIVLTCPSRTDPCMNMVNAAKCKALERADCQIVATKTCPMRFSCAPKTAAPVPKKPAAAVPKKPVAPVPKTPVAPVPKTPVASVPKKPVAPVPKKPTPKKPAAPTPTKPVKHTPKQCPFQESHNELVPFAQCVDLVKRGCTDIVPIPQEDMILYFEDGVPGLRFYSCGHTLPARPPVCPSLEAPLMTITNRAKCVSLVDKGCPKVLVWETYPTIQFYCDQW